MKIFNNLNFLKNLAKYFSKSSAKRLILIFILQDFSGNLSCFNWIFQLNDLNFQNRKALRFWNFQSFKKFKMQNFSKIFSKINLKTSASRLFFKLLLLKILEKFWNLNDLNFLKLWKFRPFNWRFQLFGPNLTCQNFKNKNKNQEVLSDLYMLKIFKNTRKRVFLKNICIYKSDKTFWKTILFLEVFAGFSRFYKGFFNVLT